MYFFTKICFFFFIYQASSALPQNYVFNYGLVSYRRIKDTPVRNQTYKFVTALDQHLFANVVDLKIRTANMKMFEGAVKNLQHLKILRIKKCGIASLAPNCFRNLPNLEEVHLQENRLTVIENRVFNYLSIKVLWLQKNNIESIRSSAFDNMPNLELIKLNNNKLTKWDSRWFANTPKLSQLFFRKNLITQLPARAFVNIKSSHKVDDDEQVDTRILLSSNKIFYIHPEALHGIDSLDELCLRRNKLEKIDGRVFAHMTEFHKLDLKLNFLDNIEADAFQQLSEMLELDLSGNSFKCLPYEIASVVKKIDMSDNTPDCTCVFNLREKMKEEGIMNEVIESECAYD